jgi:hypothetical protein
MKSRYRLILDFAKGLNLSRGQHLRTDCPACGGVNTFSVTNNDTLRFYCFKASCGVKGNLVKDMNMEEILKATTQVEEKPLLIKDTTGWVANINLQPECLRYLHDTNCMDYYREYYNKIWYDRIKNRIIFTEYFDGNSFKLAIGRSLDNSTPKWYKYVALVGSYFFARKINALTSDMTCVIVEDCASAGSVSRVSHSLALCGTTWNTLALINQLHDLNIRDVIVSLDPDAKLKSLKLQRDLQGLGKFNSVRMIQTEDDLKYVSNKDELRKLIGF